MFNLCHFLGLKSFQLVNIFLILESLFLIFYKERKVISVPMNTILQFRC